MTLFKLSLRNAKRQASDYLIYFVTIILVCAMLYAFNGLVFSQEIHQLSGMMDNLALIIVLASIVVVFIIGWLVSYTTRFMLSQRSRELGTYLLIGLENRQVVHLFFLENLAVGGIALICGIVLGNLFFQALRAILLTMFSAPYHFIFIFSPKAIGMTFLYFIAIYFFVLRKNQKRIRKMNIHDLIYFERQNESEMVKKSRTRKVMFGFSIVMGIVGTILLAAARQLMPGVIGAGCILISLSCFFISFSSGIPAFFERKPERKFRGQNLFIFRTLSAKLATMGVTMAVISILFTVSLLTEGAGMVLHGMFQGRLEKESFDLLFVSDQKDHVKACMKYAKNHVSLKDFWQYPLYQGENGRLIDYLAEHAGYLPYHYSHDYNQDVIIRYSDYAALREMLGYPAVTLKPDNYFFHCMPYLEHALSEWDQTLSIGGKKLSLAGIYTEQFSQNLWNGNGHQFLLVVPDEVCTKCPVIRYVFAAMTQETVTLSQYNALDHVIGGTMDGITTAISEWDLLYSKSLSLTETAVWSAMTVFPLFYLALTLAMTAAAVLTIQQLSEAGQYRRQFELLRKLGMDGREMRRALFCQFAIYYIMPAIPPVFISIPFILNLVYAVEPGTMVGASSPPVILAVSLGLFFLIYLIYIVIAYTSIKRNVLPG